MGHLRVVTGLASMFLFAWSPIACADSMATTTDSTNPFADATLWTLTGDYAHFFQSSGSGINYFGVMGSLKWPFVDDLALHVEGGYHHLTFVNSDGNDYAIGASLVFERPYWHFGPTFGFQSSQSLLGTANTFNYGGFGEFYSGTSLAISGLGGGFHTDLTKWDGVYVGGNVEWYPLSANLGLSGGMNFTYVPGGGFPFHETDYLGGIEWRPLAEAPVSLYAVYAYSGFSTHMHANTIYVALKFYGGAGEAGAAAPLLMQRYYTVDVSPLAQGLVFKY